MCSNKQRGTEGCSAAEHFVVVFCEILPVARTVGDLTSANAK